MPVYSISAGLITGPERAYLRYGRVQYVAITDEEAVLAFEYLSRTEGIIPAIESAHALACNENGSGMDRTRSLSLTFPDATRTVLLLPVTEGRTYRTSKIKKAFDHGKLSLSYLRRSDLIPPKN